MTNKSKAQGLSGGEIAYKITYGLFGPVITYGCVEHGRFDRRDLGPDIRCPQCGDELVENRWCPERNVAAAHQAGRQEALAEVDEAAEKLAIDTPAEPHKTDAFGFTIEYEQPSGTVFFYPRCDDERYAVSEFAQGDTFTAALFAAATPTENQDGGEQ